jgi:hypothetical protein
MQTKTENRLELEFFPDNLIIPSNKWFELEKIMPWQEIEEQLSDLFADSGRNAIPVRQIIGAWIVQSDKCVWLPILIQISTPSKFTAHLRFLRHPNGKLQHPCLKSFIFWVALPILIQMAPLFDMPHP